MERAHLSTRFVQIVQTT